MGGAVIFLIMLGGASNPIAPPTTAFTLEFDYTRTMVLLF